MRVTNEQIDRARAVNLVEYLQSHGYQLVKKGKEYCLKEHDSLCINPNNNCWRWHSQSVGGGNAIDFLRVYEGKDFISAVMELCGDSPANSTVQKSANNFYKREPVQKQNQAAQSKATQTQQITTPVTKPTVKVELSESDLDILKRLLSVIEKQHTNEQVRSASHDMLDKIEKQAVPIFVLPERNENHRRVFAYLTKTRYINPELVSSMMSQKRIYEDKEHHNCVFVTYDKNGNEKYASMRGTMTVGKPFKGDVSNSNKEYGFPITGSSERLFVYEAPIDELSYITLQIMGGNNEWSKDNYLALGGTSDVALEKYLADNPHIKQIYFALDNDKAGHKAVFGELDENGEMTGGMYKDKYTQLGYEVEVINSQGKDWNEDLVDIAESLKEKTEIEEDLEM